MWGIVRPKNQIAHFKGIIVCSFYSVPYSKRKSQLIEHITINYETLKAGNRDWFFLMEGDKKKKKNLQVQHLLNISPNFHQHNNKPTHNLNNIDVIVSDMVPSDHKVVLSCPILDKENGWGENEKAGKLDTGGNPGKVYSMRNLPQGWQINLWKWHLRI